MNKHNLLPDHRGITSGESSKHLPRRSSFQI
jgi:hypothetical protein